MRKIVTNLKASSYSGEYDVTIGQFHIAGKLSATPDNRIQDINGQVLESGQNVGSFNSYRTIDKMHTTICDIDITRVTEIGPAIADAITAAENDIKGDKR